MMDTESTMHKSARMITTMINACKGGRADDAADEQHIAGNAERAKTWYIHLDDQQHKPHHQQDH